MHINSKKIFMNRSTFCEIKYMIRLVFSKAGYMIVVGILGQVWYLIVSIPDICTLTYLAYKILIRTPVPKLPELFPPQSQRI